MIEFNAINFKIFEIPAYFFFAVVALVVSTCTFIILISQKGYNLQKSTKKLFLSIVCMGLSARFFGCLSGVYKAIGTTEELTWSVIKNTGIVFYGGLIGLLLSYWLFSKKFGMDEKEMDLLAVTIPLFHAIARIGCFFGGCCFGIEYNDVFSVMYTTMINGGEDTTQRIPIQLIEALFNYALFVFLLYLVKSVAWKVKNILNTYLAVYSIVRFFLEFLRGDIVRGIVFGISFSQGISICIWVYLVGNKIFSKKRTKEVMV